MSKQDDPDIPEVVAIIFLCMAVLAVAYTCWQVVVR